MITMVERIGYGDGGAERLAVDIAARLDPARFTSTVCATRWQSDLEEREDVRRAIGDLDAAGVELIRLERSSTYDLPAWRPLTKRLRSGTDVLHSHMFGSNAWAAVLGRICRVPVIVAHEHVWSFEGAPLRRFVDREVVARGAHEFLTISNQTRDAMIEIEGVAPDRVSVMANGIPAKDPGDGRVVRAELGVAPGAPVVGAVGLLRPQKAFEVLVEAAALLAPRYEGLRVLIVGEGPEREMLEAEIARLGIGSTVTLTGLRLDIPDVLAAMNVAVCSSDFEGSPLAVMEYMQASVPVASTDVGGVPELITDGVEGCLVPPRDPAALADAIGALLDGPERAAAIASAALEKQRSGYDLGAMIQRVEELYDSLYSAAAG